MNQLKRIRKFQGMSQETLGALAGIPSLHQEQISELENGRRPPTEPERAALAAVLGVTGEQLFPPGPCPVPEDSDGVERRAYK